MRPNISAKVESKQHLRSCIMITRQKERSFVPQDNAMLGSWLQISMDPRYHFQEKWQRTLWPMKLDDQRLLGNYWTRSTSYYNSRRSSTTTAKWGRTFRLTWSTLFTWFDPHEFSTRGTNNPRCGGWPILNLYEDLQESAVFPLATEI